MEWFEWREAPPGDFAVVGDPISHSLSPVMHRAALQALGLNLVYRAIRVPSGELGLALERLQQLGYWGINVTVPLKTEAFALAAGTDEASRRIRAVNTLNLHTREGANTDVGGLLDVLTELGVRAPGRALVLGSGGAARAVHLALELAEIEALLHARSPDRAQAMLEECSFGARLLTEPDPTGCALIVNATSAGLSGQAPRVLWERAMPSVLALDLLYGPGRSPFLEQAELTGARTSDGLCLLAAQGARSLEWWLGKSPGREAMLRALQ